MFGRRDDNDFVEFPFAAGLEQQGDVEQDCRRIGMFGNEGISRGSDHGMHNGFQGRQLARVGQHAGGKRIAVQNAADYGPRKTGFNRVKERAVRALQRAHFAVGVEQQDAAPAEHAGHGRLAHADRSGERDTDHEASSPRSRKAPSSGSSGIPRMVK